MDEVDNISDYESPHHVEYDLLLDHVVQDDHELLFLDTYLRDAFSGGVLTGESSEEEAI